MSTYSHFLSLINGAERTVDLSANTLAVQALQVNSILLSSTSSGASGASLVGDGNTYSHLAASSYSTIEATLAAIDVALGTSGSTSYDDAVFYIYNDSDNTKHIKFDASGITTATTRTLKMADANVDLANLTNSNISSSAAIALSKLAALGNNFALVSNGSGVITVSAVTATELGYVSGVTSAIQTQLNGKLSLTGGTMSGAIAMGSNKITGLASGTATGDALQWGQIGAANGIAPLDGSSKIPASYLPSVVMEYQQAWTPSTNTPSLSDGTGTNGYVYRVSAASATTTGTFADPSMTNFQVGDLVIYSGTLGEWQKAPAVDGVSSVNGATGAVTVNAINQLTGDVTASAASGSQSKATSLVATSNATLVTLSALTTASALATIGTITSGTWNGTVIGPVYGGTGLSSYATGDTLYASAANTLSKLAIGTSGQVLTVVSGVPAWSTPTTGTVTSVSVASANGLAGSSSGGATPTLTLSTTVTGVLKGNGTAISAATAGTDYSAGTSALATGILKSTTTTGALTIAVAGDFPTLNQNTTGTAANITATTNSTLTTLSALSLPTSQLSGTISAAQLGTVTDGVTLDQTGAGGTLEVKTGGIANAQISASAAIAFSKLAALASGNILVGNGSNVATSVSTSGDVTLSNAGVFAVAKIAGTTVSGTTGTGNVVFSIAPTFTGLLSGASASFSSTIAASNFSGSSSGTNTGDQTITLTGDVTGSGTGSFATTIAASAVTTSKINNAAVTAAKLGTVTDGITADQNGSGSTIEVLNAPAMKRSLVAGQTFTANTSYAVRWGLTANGETAGRVYACDTTTSSFDLFYCIGMASSAAGVTAGGNITVTTLGSFTLSSSDTAFASGTDGAPVYIGATGAFSTTAPTSSGTALTKIGIVQVRSATNTSCIIDVMPQVIGVN